MSHPLYKHFESTWAPFPALAMKPGITGILPVRNGNSLDYSWQLAAKSLLPISNELLLVDSDSNDGTREEMDAWAISEPKIRVLNFPWYDPVGDMWMLPKWINWAREQAQYASTIQLDADEVLHPRAYPRVLENAKTGRAQEFHRLNFWRSAGWLAPHGTVCSHLVVRQNPANWEQTCDGHYVKGEPQAKRQYQRTTPETLIYHLGFCRRNDAFFAKSRVVQRALVNTYDWKLAKAEEENVAWDTYAPFSKPLLPFQERDYPPGVVEWLNARNY